jgi:hypothetical protein
MYKHIVRWLFRLLLEAVEGHIVTTRYVQFCSCWFQLAIEVKSILFYFFSSAAAWWVICTERSHFVVLSSYLLFLAEGILFVNGAMYDLIFFISLVVLLS